jgi:aminoglycoside phosphotransferase (APT) family kinase protein
MQGDHDVEATSGRGMRQEEASRVELIRACLDRMGRDADELRQYEVLQGGVSGSGTYRLELATGDVILKATPADREPHVVARARREAEFYRRLADRVPVRVPRPLAIVTDDDFGICLLLARYAACPPASAWSERRYCRAGEELGRFHAAFWNRIDRLSELAWLRDPGHADVSAEAARAYGYWQELREIDRFRDILTPQRKQRIVRLLERIDEVDRALQSLPPTLCHGDFHARNLLRDGEDGFIWADWQEVGIGRGPEDLSFFIQRASFDGGAVPRDELTGAYHASLAAATGQEIPLSSILRVMDGSELRTRLLHWPAYLKQASRESLAEIVDRIDQLAGRLEIHV